MKNNWSPNPDGKNIQSGHRGGIWHWQIRHANNESQETTHNEKKQTSKSREIQNARRKGNLQMLCFDLLTQPKMPFKVMHREEVTHSNGSYERKSRGQKLADEMGRGKKKSHYALITHRKRVTSELHDSYFRSMTITQAIPKVAEVTHPGR